MPSLEKPSDSFIDDSQAKPVMTPNRGSAVPDVDWDIEEEKALVRRIDLRVFPMLCIVFGLSLLDRTNISAAYIAGLAEDLGLAIGSRYSLALLMFFPGYALFEIPSNMVIRRFGARWWLSFLIIAWGACVLGMGFIHHWHALTILRAFLGIFEAGLFPGSIFIIGSWYRQYETARRVSVFYMSALIASAFGPILAYAFSLISVGEGMYSAGWRWIFIIEGAMTVAAGFLAVIFLVDFPEKARFLNDRERHIAQARVQVEQAAKVYVHPTLKESMTMLLDWKVAAYALLYFVPAASVYALAYFKPIILSDGMGFSYTKAQLLSSPPYIFAIVASIGMAWVSDKYRTRWVILVIQAVVAIIGFILLPYGGSPGVRYFGFFLAVFGSQANVPGTLAYGQNQTPRIEKRGIISAAMISVGAAGGIAGSTIFRSQDAPMYLPGIWTTVGLTCAYVVSVVALSMHFKRENRKADAGEKILEGVPEFRYAP